MTLDEYLTVEIDRLKIKMERTHSLLDPIWFKWRTIWRAEMDYLIDRLEEKKDE